MADELHLSGGKALQIMGLMLTAGGSNGDVTITEDDDGEGTAVLKAKALANQSKMINLARLGGMNLDEGYAVLNGEQVVIEQGWGSDEVVITTSYTISGNAQEEGVTLTYTDGTEKTVQSIAGGDYEIEVPNGWSGTVTPSKDGYFFTPENKEYSNVSADVSGENYTAQLAYYVRTTGNDTTGDGSFANPWLTMTKAFTVVGAGDVLLVGDGTYAEGAAESYWTISKNLADWLLVQPEKGASGDVTISGNGHDTYNILFSFSTQSHMRFKYLKFAGTAGSTQLVRMLGTLTYIEFLYCEFIPAENMLYGIYTAANSQYIKFDHCTVKNPDSDNYQGMALSTSAVTIIDITNSEIRGSANFLATAAGICAMNGALGGLITIDNCDLYAGMPAVISSPGGTFAFNDCRFTGGQVIVGADGSGDQSSATITATFKDCVINKTGTTGHALILGVGCTNCIVDNVTIDSSWDYAIVLKEHTGTEVKNCTLVGGSSSALLYKAAIGVNCHHNTLTGTGTVGAFQLRNGDSGHKCQGWKFENNIVNVTGEASKALVINNDTHDDGGGVCDYNTYQNNSGLGLVRNDTNVANLAELQAAWADYDVTTNDAHSTVV